MLLSLHCGETNILWYTSFCWERPTEGTYVAGDSYYLKRKKNCEKEGFISGVYMNFNNVYLIDLTHYDWRFYFIF